MGSFTGDDLQDPHATLIIEIFGDIDIDIAKLFACVELNIWKIVDWILITKTIKEKNFRKFLNVLKKLTY